MQALPAPGEADASATARRWRAAAGLGLAAVVFGSLFFTVHPWYDPTNDGSMYIATARALAAGEGYRYLGIPFLIRPPGFACLLAPLLALLGTNFLALNLFVSLWGAAGVLAFHVFLRARLGLLLATLVPLLLWFNPGYQRLCNQVMSDVPGWTLLVACLALAARQRRRGGAKGALVLGAAIAFTSYVRSGNLLLVPAVLAAAILRETFVASERVGWRRVAREAGACLLGVVLVLAPWSARNRAVAPPPPADQTLLYSYSTGMFHEDMGDPRSPRVPPAEILGRFPVQGGKSLFTLGTRLQDSATPPLTGAAPSLVAWLLIGALGVTLVRRRACEEAFALGTLLVVAFYFGYAGRLLLPVFALGVVALLELLRDAATRLAGPRVGTAVPALLCLAWIAVDWRPRADWEAIEGLHRAYAENARRVREVLPEGARLGAWRGWHHAVFLERPVYSFELACKRAGSPAASETIVEKYGLDWILLTPLGLPASVQQAERQFAAFVAERHGTKDLGLVRVR